jgi:hypothetical protein
MRTHCPPSLQLTEFFQQYTIHKHRGTSGLGGGDGLIVVCILFSIKFYPNILRLKWVGPEGIVSPDDYFVKVLKDFKVLKIETVHLNERLQFHIF